MLLNIETMGCGRSKHHSPKLGSEEVEVYVSASANKKKKLKDDKKENRAPNSNSSKPQATKTSPLKVAGNFLKPPAAHVNGSSQQVLHIDVEYPAYKDKDRGDLSSPTKGKDGSNSKEFSGKTNIKITNSQIEFFKMLDEKIEQGDDYKSQDSMNLLQTP